MLISFLQSWYSYLELIGAKHICGNNARDCFSIGLTIFMNMIGILDESSWFVYSSKQDRVVG